MLKRIISYNVNGIRAAIEKGLLTWIKNENPYIICFQETKAQDSQINLGLLEYLGYESSWNSALKKGYSGVGIISKDKPDRIEKGMGYHKYDSEGRVIRADFGDLTVVNVYIPSGTTGDIRQDFKMGFLEDFFKYMYLLKQTRQYLVVSGDFNICHKPVDINHPERHKKSSGFLPEEREWMYRFVNAGFIDSFREFNDQPEMYSWWSYRANSRSKNLGWRIDYHMISPALRPDLISAGILSDINHSDHCPVYIDIEI